VTGVFVGEVRMQWQVSMLVKLRESDRCLLVKLGYSDSCLCW
jgi:hypothetical protein